MNSSKITLVTGGSRSGKSRFSLELAQQDAPRVFLATAEACDAEMSDRIRRHQDDRGDSFSTVEEPLDLVGALSALPPETEVVLIDCLTVWLGNLMHQYGVSPEPYPEVVALREWLPSAPFKLIFVTNEVGSGIIPADAMTRVYRDHAGWLNQDIAALADTVYWVVSGISIKIKG